MYKFSTGQLPPAFSNYFIQTSSVQHHFTRSSVLGYSIPFSRTAARQKSIKYHGPLVWNNLPQEVKESVSVSVFKNTLKRHLLDSYQ